MKLLACITSLSVTRKYLNASAAGSDKGLNCGGKVTASELFLLRLTALHDRDGHQVRVNAAVELQNLEDLFFGLGSCRKGCVPFLPEELAGSKERLRMLELPTLLTP